jgi:hypothetical protein
MSEFDKPQNEDDFKIKERDRQRYIGADFGDIA